MATELTFTMAERDADCGFIEGAVFDNTDQAVMGNSSGNVCKAFIRFETTLPASVNIVTAKLRLLANINGLNEACKVKIHVNDIGDAVAPTSTGEYNALDVSTAFVAKTIPTWTSGVYYEITGLADAIQAAVDHDDWDANQAIMVLIEDNGSDANADRQFTGYSAPYDREPQLTVTYDITVDMDGAATLPAFSASIVETGIIVTISAVADFVTLPSFSAEGIGTTSDAAIAAILPAFEAAVAGRQAGIITVTLPALTAALERGAVATATIPALTVSLTGSIVTRAVGNATIPALTVTGTLIHGVLGDGAVTIPALSAALAGYTGQTGSITATLPIITVAGTMAHVPTGDITATMPSLEVLVAARQSGRFTSCTLLAYPDVINIVGDIVSTNGTIPAFTASLTEP